MDGQEKTLVVKKESSVKYLVGGLSVIFSLIFFYITYSEGFIAKDFWFTLLTAVVLGVVAFICFSKMKRINNLLTSVLCFGGFMWTLYYLLYDTPDDFWTTLIWTIGFFVVGLVYLLRFFNRSLSLTVKSSVRKFIQSEGFRLTVKIVFWCAIIAIGLLIFGGIFSLIAGLSATTIIIILLVLILLK